MMSKNAGIVRIGIVATKINDALSRPDLGDSSVHSHFTAPKLDAVSKDRQVTEAALEEIKLLRSTDDKDWPAKVKLAQTVIGVYIYISPSLVFFVFPALVPDDSDSVLFLIQCSVPCPFCFFSMFSLPPPALSPRPASQPIISHRQTGTQTGRQTCKATNRPTKRSTDNSAYMQRKNETTRHNDIWVERER